MAKCVRCGQVLPENYAKKTCAVCLEKRKQRHAVESASKKLERESEQFAKKLREQGYTLPKHLASFSAYQKTMQEFWHKKLTWEDYQREREEYVKNQIQKKTDAQVSLVHRRQKGLLRFLCSFLLPDRFPFSHEEKCRNFRLQKLGYYPEQEPFLTDHIEVDLCKSCGDWWYNLHESTIDNPMMINDNDVEMYLVYKSENPKLSRRGFIKMLRSINGHIVAVDKKLGKFVVVVKEPNPNIHGETTDLSKYDLFQSNPKDYGWTDEKIKEFNNALERQSMNQYR